MKSDLDYANQAADSKQSGYKKELGFWTVVFLATGGILGPAVGFTPVSVLALAGPSGILSWIIAFLLIMAVAMAYVELGTMWPKAGGVAYYPAKSSGPIVGVMNAWGSFVGYALAVPSIVVAFVEYLSYWFPGLYKGGTLTTTGIVSAIAVTVVIFWINTLRIRYMGQLNNIFTVLTIVGLVVVSVVLLTHMHPSNFHQFHGFVPFGTSGLFLAISATIYGYGGFRQPIDYAEEVKDPGKTIPKAVFLTMIITLIIYFLESLSYLGAINWKGIGVQAGNWSGLSSLAYPFVSIGHGVGLPIIGLIAMITMLIASFKDGYIYFGGASRVGYSLSYYDGYLPKVFTNMTKNGIPLPSVLLVLVVSSLYIILLPSFSSLFPLVASALLLSYAPGPLSLAIFRTKYPHEPRPYVLPAYKILAPFAFVISTLMIYWSGWASVHILIPSVFIGLLLLFFYRKHSRITQDDWRRGLWLPIFQIILMGLSYIGSKNFGGHNLIPSQWDTVVVGIVALVFYYWGLSSGLKWQEHDTFTESPSAGAVTR
ncbi:APC family permease [Sulfobacillus thermosulfidooxidans]|uniref:APC family permease n=1 Tax=Sulfobacillus thermosulfidooxidans TaxID=28034 RepID=UPI00096B91E0|nr:APC family permease [Sulfobacillus thermosulfidooxidans]OLZ10377.1 amino acid transporter [Sulfobacillus thermosulfidooxidans]OLZ15255.1 amino acid transporter [Sulfobacillus thermosulfidooxidans]OLZ21124.1 amino acid transporter [Sulfobacillus thermosulfidooxidans]